MSKQYDDQFPLGFVLIYVGLFFAAWIYVSSVNSADDTRIASCADNPRCTNPWGD